MPSTRIKALNWRWLILDFVDPALPISRPRRLWLAWRIYRRHVRWDDTGRRANEGGYVYYGYFLLLFCIVCWGIVAFIGPESLGPMTLVTVLLFLPLACGWVAFVILYRGFFRRAAAFALRHQGYEVCPSCGYWLRGLDDSSRRCPECGEERADPAKVTTAGGGRW